MFREGTQGGGRLLLHFRIPFSLAADRASSLYSSRTGSRGPCGGTTLRLRWAASRQRMPYTSHTGARRFPGTAGRCCEHRSRAPSFPAAPGFPASGRDADGSC